MTLEIDEIYPLGDEKIPPVGGQGEVESLEVYRFSFTLGDGIPAKGKQGVDHPPMRRYCPDGGCQCGYVNAYVDEEPHYCPVCRWPLDMPGNPGP